MSRPLVLEDALIAKVDLRSAELSGEYVRCIFEHVNLNSADLGGISFVECKFRDCDLSVAQLTRTSFRTVSFERCKLLGARFDACHTFLLAFSFSQCVLDLACFHGLRLKGTRFLECRMREADLAGADFSNASFVGCDLGAAIFDNTVLVGADFRNALHYSIDPATNKLRKARFSRNGIVGLLDRSGIIIED